MIFKEEQTSLHLQEFQSVLQTWTKHILLKFNQITSKSLWCMVKVNFYHKKDWTKEELQNALNLAKLQVATKHSIYELHWIIAQFNLCK